MPQLLVRDLGRREYLSALSYQLSLLKEKQEKRLGDVLLLLEHPHVFTMGPAAKEKNLLFPGDIPVHRTSRGGDVTYHGPGQVVVYPLIDLKSKLRKAVHTYLHNLEKALTDTLDAFGIHAERRPGCTGVWIGIKKIAAIGIAVRRGIVFHGAALNVNPDLAYYDRIVPCGLAWARVTSMERELERAMDPAVVKEVLVRCFARRFGYTEILQSCQEDTPIG